MSELNLGIVGQLRPILQTLGLDPSKLVQRLARQQVSQRFALALPAVVARLEADGMTPAAKGDGPEAERLVIRSVLYLLLKEALKPAVKQGVSYAADYARDRAQVKICAAVAPQVTKDTPTAELVRIVAEAYLELLF